MAASTLRQLDLSQITVDRAMQHRKLEYTTLDKYCQLMAENVVFPPVEVVYDGTTGYLWDGFHRVECAKRLQRQSIQANVQTGTREYAIWMSFSANAKHGMPRPLGAVTEILETLWANPEWRKKGATEIANHVGCSRQMVYLFQRKKEPMPVPPKEPEPVPVSYEPPKPLLDNAGTAIPLEKVDQWLGRTVVQARIDELEAILQTITTNRNSPAYAMIKWRGFRDAILLAKSYLLQAIPHTVCIDCNGAGCEKCRSGFKPLLVLRRDGNVEGVDKEVE